MSQFKILLVDDEEEFVKTLGERLEMRGLGPDTAFTGRALYVGVAGNAARRIEATEATNLPVSTPWA